jgi:hypothetical protein
MDSWIRGFVGQDPTLETRRQWQAPKVALLPLFHFKGSCRAPVAIGAWLLGQVRVREAMATRKRSHGDQNRRRLLHLQLALWRGGIIMVRAVPLQRVEGMEGGERRCRHAGSSVLLLHDQHCVGTGRERKAETRKIQAEVRGNNGRTGCQTEPWVASCPGDDNC